MAKTKDQYRKVRRAIKKAKQFKMKGKALEGYMLSVKRRVAKLGFLALLVAASSLQVACFEKYTVSGATQPTVFVCSSPSPYPLNERGPVELTDQALCR